MCALFDVFRGRIISSGIWTSLKGKVYSSNLLTEELRQNVCKKITDIPAEQLRRVSEPIPLALRMSTCTGTAYSHLL
jgi:hypothetical protein